MDIPESLMTAIRHGYHVATERFGCPLNFNKAMSGILMRMAWDITRTSEDMQKAIRWTRASAEQNDLPSLTGFALPFSGATHHTNSVWIIK